MFARIVVCVCFFSKKYLFTFIKFGTGDVHKNSFRDMTFLKIHFGENHACF